MAKAVSPDQNPAVEALRHTVGPTDLHGLPSNRALHSLILLNRLSLGWYVMQGGWEKLAGELGGGLGTFFLSAGFQNRNPAWLPDFVALPYAYALPWLETTFGLFIIVGLFGRLPAAVAAVLLFSIGIALLAAGELLPRHYVMVFFPLALMLSFLGPGRYSIDGLIQGRKEDTKH